MVSKTFVSASSLMEVYKCTCERAKEDFMSLLGACAENVIERGNNFAYLVGQVELLEILLDGIYPKELLKEIKGPLDSIENISIRG